MKRLAFICVALVVLAGCSSIKQVTYQPCLIATDVCSGIQVLCQFLSTNQDSLIASPAKLELTLAKIDTLTDKVHTELHTLMDEVNARAFALKQMQKGRTK